MVYARACARVGGSDGRERARETASWRRPASLNELFLSFLDVVPTSTTWITHSPHSIACKHKNFSSDSIVIQYAKHRRRARRPATPHRRRRLSMHSPRAAWLIGALASAVHGDVHCGGRYVSHPAPSCDKCGWCDGDDCVRVRGVCSARAGHEATAAAPQTTMAWRGPWRSQELQDCVAHALSGSHGGYFIDLAANDAFIISNTLMLEKSHGWTGLTIEPNPIYHPAHLKLRHNSTLVPFAVSNENAEREFKFSGVFGSLGGSRATNIAAAKRGGSDDHHRGGHSGTGGHSGNNINNMTMVRVLRTDDLFRSYGVPRVIDYMSLDVETHEAEVLSAFPWESHTVSVLTIESVTPSINATLYAHGYRHLCNLNHVDDVFVHWQTMRHHALVRAVARGEAALTCERGSEEARLTPLAQLPPGPAASDRMVSRIDCRRGAVGVAAQGSSM